MNDKSIVVALTSALDATGDLPSRLDLELPLLPLLLYYAEHEPQKVDERLSNLLSALRYDPSLRIFDGLMQVVANEACRVEYGGLAVWLIERGLTVGAEQAVLDLHRYVDATEIPYLLTCALSGIKIEEPCTFGRGVMIVPWDSLPESHQKRAVYNKFVTTGSFQWPTAAVVREHILPKVHVPANETGQYVRLDDTDLHDAVLCAGLVGPSAPHILASWLAPPPWAPVMIGALTLSHLEGQATHHDWREPHCAEASTLFQAFAALGDTHKPLLRLAMQRLNSAMRRASPVDSAIDLGIALEAVFLSDMSEERGESTFKLRIRASRFLGTTKEKREHLYKLVGDLYSARSSAVHTGRVSPKIGSRPLRNLLEEGYCVTADAIKRYVLTGKPDWNSVMFA